MYTKTVSPTSFLKGMNALLKRENEEKNKKSKEERKNLPGPKSVHHKKISLLPHYALIRGGQGEASVCVLCVCMAACVWSA